MVKRLLLLIFYILYVLLKELTRLVVLLFLVLFIITFGVNIAKSLIIDKPYELDIAAFSQEKQYKISIVIDQNYYNLGEPVHLYLAITNTSSQTIFLPSPSSSTPAVDIVMRRVFPEEPSATYIWSQMHSGQIGHDIYLQPGETYTLEWTLVLKQPGIYEVQAFWIEPSVVYSRPSHKWSRAITPCVLYGVPRDEPAVWALCHPLNINKQTTNQASFAPPSP